MKYFKYSILPISFFTILLSSFLSFFYCNAMDQLNPFALNDDQAQELLNILENLSPEEQALLDQFTHEITNQMETEGLDPNNPNDLAKWMEKEMATSETAPIKSPKQEPAKPQEQPIIVPVVSPSDTNVMLKDIIDSLASLRQKAAISSYMGQDLRRWEKELNELSYYLHILSKESLIKYLASKDFTKLYKSLEKLHNTLVAYEPLITVRQPSADEEEDPYEILEIPYNATSEQIEQAFNKLKQEKSPEALAQKLETENISEKARQKYIKEARLSFSFIQNAYDSLINPKERALINRSLKDRIEQEKHNTQASDKAFKKIVDTINHTLNVDKILNEIQKLLEKYKPEELAQAKAQEELEKKAIEMAKQPVKMAQPPIKPSEGSEKQYEAFYQQLEKEKIARQYAMPSFKPEIPKLAAPPAPSTKGETEAPSGGKKSEGKGGEKKEDKKKDEKKDGKKKEDKGGKKDSKKSEGKKTETEKKDEKKESKEGDKKEEEITDIIKDIEKVLKSSKEYIEIPIAAKSADKSNKDTDSKRSPTKEDGESSKDKSDKAEKDKKVKKLEFKSIIKDIDSYLTNPIKRSLDIATIKKDMQPAINLVEFAKQNKFNKLKEKLAELKKAIGNKVESDKVKSLWKDKISGPYAKRISSWYKEIYSILDSASRNNANKPAIDPSKIKLLKLDAKGLKESKDKDKGKDKKDKADQSKEAPSLGEIKNLVYDINAAYQAISKVIEAK